MPGTLLFHLWLLKELEVVYTYLLIYFICLCLPHMYLHTIPPFHWVRPWDLQLEKLVLSSSCAICYLG